MIDEEFSKAFDDCCELQLSQVDKKRAREVIEDQLGLAHEGWPCRLANLFSSRHLNMAERFELTNFLLCNGVHGDWVMAHYENQGCLRDDSAKRDVQSMWERYRKTGRIFTDTCILKGNVHFYYDVAMGHECLSEPFDIDRHCFAIYKILGISPKEFRIQTLCKAMQSPRGVLTLSESHITSFAGDIDKILFGNQNRGVRYIRKRVMGIFHEIVCQHCRITPKADNVLAHMLLCL